MMQVLNDTALRAAWIPGKVRQSDDALTLIVKGTYRLQPGGTAVAEEDEPLLPTGDEPWDDDPEHSLRYANDFALFKPRADLLLAGTCHAPGGAPQGACRVSFGVGRWAKTLAVAGDRYWTGDPRVPSRTTEPVPFTAMPLRYERAFGGEGWELNPVGRGLRALRTADGQPYWPLPNVEYPAAPVRGVRDRPAPAGFGPLPLTWAPRSQNAGTYGDDWLAERWPWFPDDFDWGCMNAAPPDQQVEGYLKGDEALSFEHLHPEHPTYRTRLPGVRPRCFVEDATDEGPRVREVELCLDTLWVDMDAELAVLVWRGLTAVRSPKYEELTRLLVVSEPLEEAPAPAEVYLPRFAAPEPEEAEEEALETPGKPAALPDFAAIAGQARQHVGTMLDEMVTRQGGPRPDVQRAKGILLDADPESALDGFLREVGITAADTERVHKEIQGKAAGMLTRHGLDPGLLVPAASAVPEAPVPPGPPTGPEVEARVKAGGSLAEEDLSGADLTGLRLAGGDFRGCVLAGARLAGIDLSGADLSGAVLSGADLQDAKLREARLVEADLSGARAGGADFSGADLQDAVLDGADLIAAVLSQARCAGAAFTGCKLSRARLDGAMLEGCDFGGSTVDESIFDGASLGGAALGDAAGNGVSMRGADLTALRAGDGCRLPNSAFTGARGDGSIWTGAVLEGADFSGCDLVGADFSGADLTGASLHAADLRNGKLAEASLAGARVTRANLFQATLEGADLTRTDLRGSNLFQAEVWNAVLAETDVTGADLGMTKIEHHMRGA